MGEQAEFRSQYLTDIEEADNRQLYSWANRLATSELSMCSAKAPGARPSAPDAVEHLQRIVEKPRKRRKRVIVAGVWLALCCLASP